MMINKILFSCILMCGIHTELVAQPVDAVMNKNKIVLKDLDFKTVMKSFYQQQIQYVKIPQLDQSNIQYVGIKNAEYTHVFDRDDAVIVFSPASAYQNAQNELRYLVSTTEVSIDKNNELLNFCGVCTTFTKIYLFKKNALGQFELVSQSQDENSWMNADFNYLPYPTENIVKNIRKIGPRIKGYVEEQAYSRQGYSTSTLYIIPFDENPVMVKLEVAEIGNDNEVTGSDKIYNTQADYGFLSTEHDGLYDIEIHYSGTQQIYVGDIAKILPINETHVYQYNEKQQKYIRVKLHD